MIYVYECPDCGSRAEQQRPVALRDQLPMCAHGQYNLRPVEMTRLITVPQLITQPFHLKEGNRFQGDATDKLAFQRKYSHENREKRNEEDRSFARAQADIQGAQVVKSIDTPSLLDMAKQQGAQVSG